MLTAIRVLILVCVLAGQSAWSQAYEYRLEYSREGSESPKTVIGFLQSHRVAEDETLLDIARDYGLGYNEMEILYPDLDPWIPKTGLELTIPTRWVLPRTGHFGVVINLPELRLYRFFPKAGVVKTYPIGIGDINWETPLGVYRVVERRVKPTWRVPLSIQKEVGKKTVPPGPENPLGSHWLGLSTPGYGIHGTNFPWGVGRLVSHGCIRLYPEHIVRFFEETPVGTPVEIVYEPVKFGIDKFELYMEVHPDPYGRIDNLRDWTIERLRRLELVQCLLMDEVDEALRRRDGVPVVVGIVKRGVGSEQQNRRRMPAASR